MNVFQNWSYFWWWFAFQFASKPVKHQYVFAQIMFVLHALVQYFISIAAWILANCAILDAQPVAKPIDV